MISVPPVLTNLALICACAIGLTTVIWTLVKPPEANQEGADITRGKTSLRLRGRAVFQMFLGAALVLSPILASNTVRAAIASTPSFIDVDTIPDPKYESFVFVRDTSILDLRGSRAQPLLAWIPVLGRKTNPANLINTMLIRKISAADTISFKYATSGSLDIRCLTQNCTIRRAVTHPQTPASEVSEAWELTANVKSVPLGTEFEMVVEVTYWKAFDTPAKQWYETYSNNQTEPEVLATLLIFPDGTPFKSFDLMQSDTNGALRPYAGQSTVMPGADNQTLYWEIPSAGPNEVVRVNWSY